MSALQQQFADRFGEDQASAVLGAAIEHNNDVHGNTGSDPFRWALTITIGYECWSKDGYRKYHGITADADEIRQWIKDHANLADHDGDFDYLAAFAGAYDEYMPGGAP